MGPPLRPVRSEKLGAIGLVFQGVESPSYRVHLPDRVLDVVPDALADATGRRP